MRFGIATSLFVATLASAGGSVAHAQASWFSGAGVSMDCPSDPVASALDGGSLDASDVVPDAEPMLDPVHDLDFGDEWCTDANDPRCAPMAPTPAAPSLGDIHALPRWLPTSFEMIHVVSVNVLPEHDFPALTSERGPLGFAMSLDRPPRSR